jgi:hypothetical protein
VEVYFDQLDSFVAMVSECLHGEDWLFRGHADWQAPLVPAIDRPPLRGPLGRDLEREMVERFRFLADRAVDPAPRDGLEWLALAHAHGIPTRLLEWTRNPLVALYRAVEDPSLDDRGAMSSVLAYRSTTFEFYQSLSDEERADPLEIGGGPRVVSVATSTPGRWTPPRTLTLHPEPVELDRKAAYEGELHTIFVPDRARQLLRAELRLLGVSAASVSSDLDALARDIREDVMAGLAPPQRTDNDLPPSPSGTLH